MMQGLWLLWEEQICPLTLLLHGPVPGHLEGMRETGLHRQQPPAWPFLLLSLC